MLQKLIINYGYFLLFDKKEVELKVVTDLIY
jgi:hypothetical protein